LHPDLQQQTLKRNCKTLDKREELFSFKICQRGKDVILTLNKWKVSAGMNISTQGPFSFRAAQAAFLIPSISC
jgi:hypothetical protein